MIEYTFGELSRLFTIQIVDVSLRQMAVIANLGTDREDLIRAGLEAAAARIVERVRREFGRPAMVCTGPIVGSIDEIPSSYGVGVELARYRLVLPDRPLLTSTDDVLSTRAVYVYPADIEKRIIDQVLLGHQQAVPPLLDEFSSRVRRFRYNEIVLSLTQLVLMISRAAPAALETSIQARWAALTSEQRLTDSRTLEEIVGWIGEVCAELVAEARRREDTAHAATVDKVKELVSKRFAESSLCAATLADSVGFSTNYLRSIFKTTTGVSLSDHIAQRRFEHAEKLLTTTTISAKEVAVMCGFFNAEYFYFAFRKRTGQTPGSYRKARRP
jgi:AraC-like DNA-binding protein